MYIWLVFSSLAFLSLAWALWKYAIRCCIRDRLFTLRDELRRRYVSAEIPLDSATYVAMRSLFNSHLRLSRERFLFRVIFLQAQAERKPDVADALKSLAFLPESEHAGVAQKDREARTEAAKLLLLNEFFSSALLLLFGILILLLRAVGKTTQLVLRIQPAVEAYSTEKDKQYMGVNGCTA